MLTRDQALNLLIKNPVKFAHILGFTKLTDLHNEWIKKMVRGKEDYTLMAHRGSYKTTCVSISLAIIIITLPNYRTMFMRKTDADIKEIIKQVGKILKDPHTAYIVQCIYGVNIKLTTDSTTEISTNLTTDTKGTSQLVGVGIGGSLTGKHFDRIFTDDIINVKDRVSKAERENTKLIYQELQNIRNPGGRIINTLTPWHKDDASTLMPSPVKYDCYSTGLMTEEDIQNAKDHMTASLFAANYQLVHIASEDIIFPNPHTGADIEKVMNSRYGHIDAAYNGEDYTAYTIVKREDDKIYVYGRLWRKHVDDVQDEIISIHNFLLCQRIYNEDNGDKGYLAKELRKKGVKVISYHESMNKFLKITSHLKGAWKNVIFVAGTDQEYIDQVSQYNENADHDDAPDSLASIIRELTKKKKEDETYKPLWN